jgi:predicted lipoprotein with Yx(FWY)xxD motif
LREQLAAADGERWRQGERRLEHHHARRRPADSGRTRAGRLYFWAKDQKPGDKTGDGFNGVWHIAQ